MLILIIYNIIFNMSIISFNFDSFNAKKRKLIKGDIKVSFSPHIKNVKYIKNQDNDALLMNFEFVVVYEPKIADIIVRGNLCYQLKDRKLKKQILKNWEKDKKLPYSIVEEVMRIIFVKCLTKIIYLTDELQLPPPIPMPKMEHKSDMSYIG